LCTGNVNLLKLGGRPARPLSTFAPAGRLLCSCRSALLSPFGGTATHGPLLVLGSVEAARCNAGTSANSNPSEDDRAQSYFKQASTESNALVSVPVTQYATLPFVRT
jgi:hypothetical protein